MNDVSGWIATILTLASVWLLGKKNPAAFVVSLVGNSIWIAAAFGTSWPIVATNVTIAAINIRNLRLWRAERAHKEAVEADVEVAKQVDFECAMESRLTQLAQRGLLGVLPGAGGIPPWTVRN